MEFLFENPFLLIILIGLISSFFKKAKGEGEQEQRPKRPVRSEPPKAKPMSPSEEPRQPSNTRRNQQPLNRGEREPVPTISQSALTDIQKKSEERREERARAGSEDPGASSSIKPPVVPGRNDITQESKGTLQLRPEADRLIEGIAWAQVLGPPRSKAPHRTMRR